MVAKPAGCHLYQRLPVAGFRNRHVAYFQFWRVAGLFYKKGFHTGFHMGRLYYWERIPPMLS
jgi:hypothetical protein